MTRREELVQELKNTEWDGTQFGWIADFILEREKTIVEPLVKWKSTCNAFGVINL